MSTSEYGWKQRLSSRFLTENPHKTKHKKLCKISVGKKEYNNKHIINHNSF